MIQLERAFYSILKSIVTQVDPDAGLFAGFSAQDWSALYELSITQGLTAIVYRQLKPVADQVNIPKDLLRQWRIHSLTIDQRMGQRNMTCVEFAEKMSERDIPVVALKGIAYAAYYPSPNLRECGDLDCYMMGKKDCGDKAVVEIGGRIEEAGQKHSHLFYKGLTIENHEYFTNFGNTERGRYTEKLLQKLVVERSSYLGKTKLLCPCPEFTALFLIKHAQRHFLYEGIRMRHITDWAFFMKAEQDNVNWSCIIPEMEKCGVLEFARLMTSICSNALGLDVHVDALRNAPKKVERLHERFLDDVMGDQPEIYDRNLLKRAYRGVRRFYRMWKYRAVADESYLTMAWNVYAFGSLGKKKLEL